MGFLPLAVRPQGQTHAGPAATCDGACGELDQGLPDPRGQECSVVTAALTLAVPMGRPLVNSLVEK
jgi:hypothetical protein